MSCCRVASCAASLRRASCACGPGGSVADGGVADGGVVDGGVADGGVAGVGVAGVGVADGGVADGSELGSGSGSLRFRVDVGGVEDEDAVDQRFAAPAFPELTRPDSFLNTIESREELACN